VIKLAIAKGINPVLILVGATVGLIVLGIFGGLSILGAQNSANLASSVAILSQSLVIIGVGVFIGLITMAMKLGGSR